MARRRVRVELVLEADCDPVPGTFNDPDDWRQVAEQALLQLTGGGAYNVEVSSWLTNEYLVDDEARRS